MMAPADTAQDLAGAARRLEVLASQHEQDAVASAAAELAQRLEQNRFHLVVVGQFKRGKTTFLNALLGEALLPVAVLPLTSVVTVLRFGRTPRAVVHFQDRRTSEIPLDRLTDYVTEAGNPRNVKGVAYVEVFHPSPYLEGGVTLIDTPGVASVYEHNTQVTYEFLPRMDAAIFITSPEPPLTSAEIEFLRDLGKQVGRIFFVMNKADAVEPGHLAEVLDFVRRSLPRDLPADTSEIFPISARLALEAKQKRDHLLLERSGLPALERRIEQFLREEKNRVFQTAAARRLLALAAELRMLLKLEIQAAQMPLEELQARISEFDRQLRLAQQQREDNRVLLRAGLARLSASFENAAREFAESQIPAVTESARRHFQASASLPRRKLAAEMDRFIATTVHQLFEQWRNQFERQAFEEFRAVAARFQESTNELADRVRRTAGELFGIEIAPLELADELAWLESTGYYTDTLLDWGLGNAPLLLPGPLFRRYLLNRVLKAVREELDRNATRVAYDFKRRLQKSVSDFERSLEAKLDEAIRGIRHAMDAALRKHQTDSTRVRELVEELSTAIEELDRLEAAIREAAPAGVAN
jgi:GTP-binding protein EngB required for normal cell division